MPQADGLRVGGPLPGERECLEASGRRTAFHHEELLLTVAKGLEYTALARELRSLKQFIENRFFRATNVPANLSFGEPAAGPIRRELSTGCVREFFPAE
jgi:hypothetical protein